MSQNVNLFWYLKLIFVKKITMHIKKPLLSVLIVFILSNLLTTFWYMLTDEANFVPYRRAEINYLALLINHLLYACLIVYLFPYYYQHFLKRWRGFVFGCITAALMFLPQAIVIRAIWKVDFNMVFVLNTLAHVFIGGVLGWTITFMYHAKNKTLKND